MNDTIFKEGFDMKKTRIVSLIIASSMLLAACGGDAQETSGETAASTAAQTQVTETEPTETEPVETEPEIVEITPENILDTDPASSEWAASGEAGDIISLVDMQYLADAVNAPEPDDYVYAYFDIYTASDLATLTYYVNVYPDTRNYGGDSDFFVKVNLMADIDLSGYNWAPLGYDVNGSHNQSFSGIFNGNGHTISGLTIDNGRDDNAFFGDVYDSTVFGITIEGAEIHGADSSIFARYVGHDNFFDCHADGQAVDNTTEGPGLFNVESTSDPNRYLYCTMNVAGANGIYYSEEEPVVLNPYPEGGNNIYLEVIDPEGDGTFEYPDGDIFSLV